MFHLIREQASSQRYRRGSVKLELEELEQRDVPAVHALLASAINLTAPAATMAIAPAASTNGAASQMPGFYEDHQVTVNMKEEPDMASASLIAHNKSINTIYAYADLDLPQPFKPVINA